MAKSLDDHQKSEAILRQFPQPLSRIYQSVIDALAATDYEKAFTNLHRLCEKTLTYCCIYLNAEKLNGKVALSDDERNNIKRSLLEPNPMGDKVSYLREFSNGDETAIVWQYYRRSLDANLLGLIGDFNSEYKTAEHQSIPDRKFAVELLEKHLERIVRSVARQQIFTELELGTPCNNGEFLRLTGISDIHPKSPFDLERVVLVGQQKVMLELYPFFALKYENGPVTVYNIAKRIRHDNRPTEIEFFGTYSSERIAVVADPEGRIGKLLLGHFGNLSSAPRSTYLDSFSDLEYKIKDFSGRAWLFEDVNHFVSDPTAGSLFLITGKPGTGKSSFMLEHRKRRRDGDATFPAADYSYFFFSDLLDTRNGAINWIEHLTDDLQKQTGISIKSRKKSGDSASKGPVHKLIQFIGRIRNEDPDRRDSAVVLVIDGVDEMKSKDIGPFVESINRIRLVHDLKIVLASRDIVELNRLTPPDVTVKLEDDDRNLADLRLYAQTRLRDWSEEDICEVINRTGAVFLYLSSVVADIVSSELTKDDLPSLPGNMQSYYAHIVNDRMPKRFQHNGLSWDDTGFKILMLLIALRKEPSRLMLSRYTGLDVKQIRNALDLMSELLVCREDECSPSEKYSFFHKSFREFLQQTFQDEIVEAHNRIIDYYLPKIRDDDFHEPDSYFFYHLLEHLELTHRRTILSDLIGCKSQFRERVNWLLREYSLDEGFESRLDSDSDDERLWGDGVNSAVILPLLRGFLADEMFRSNSISHRALLSSLARLYPVWRTLSRVNPAGFNYSSVIPLWEYQRHLMTAPRYPLLATALIAITCIDIEVSAQLESRMLLLDCELADVVLGAWDLNDLLGADLHFGSVNTEMAKDIVSSPSPALQREFDRISPDFRPMVPSTEWKLSINTDKGLFDARRISEQLDKHEDSEFAQRFASFFVAIMEMLDDRDREDLPANIEVTIQTLTQNMDGFVMLSAFLVDLESKRDITPAQFLKLAYLFPTAGFRLLLASQAPERLRASIQRNDQVLSFLFSTYRSFITEVLEPNLMGWMWGEGNFRPEHLRIVEPWIRSHIPDGMKEIDSHIITRISTIGEPEHLLHALEFFIPLVEPERISDELARRAMAAYWACVGLPREGEKPTYFNSTFFTKVSELLNSRFPDDLMNFFVERADYCLQSRSFIYQTYVKPKDPKLQPIKDVLYNVCIRDLKVHGTIGGKTGYAQVFSIDLPDNGDLYLDRLCGEDEDYVEELLERTRPENLSTLENILFQEIGTKPLLPSENRKLKALVNEAFDWGWSTDELINRILECASTTSK